MRTLTCIAALCAAMLMSHSAFAASAVVKACRTDIKSQCGDEMKSGGAALKECMKKHFSDLSEDCQVAIIRAASVGKACKADEKKLCGDAKPGGRPGGLHEIACSRPQRRLQRGFGQVQRKVGELWLSRAVHAPASLDKRAYAPAGQARELNRSGRYR